MPGQWWPRPQVDETAEVLAAGPIPAKVVRSIELAHDA